MKMTPPLDLRGERGTILILALIFAVILGFLVAGAVTVALRQNRTSEAAMNQTAMLALAEGACDVVQQKVLSESANFATPAPEGTVDIATHSCQYTVDSLGPIEIVGDDVGTFFAMEAYRITAIAASGVESATVSRVVQLSSSQLYQYMVFFNGDLEINPGPSMTLGGRVHANGDIYLGCGSGNTLTAASDYFRASGRILRQFKYKPGDSGGTVKLKVYQDPSYVNMAPADDADNSNWLTLSKANWKGSVQDASHGVQSKAVPEVDTIKAIDPVTGEKGYYHANADLVIKDNKAYSKAGVLLSLPAGTLVEKTMYDARQEKNIKVTEVDVALLNSSGVFPSNGLIYAYRTDATASNPNGIRLTQGKELRAPLTVVTQGPLFVRGDFNTVNKVGAAVIADAVNLLSNAWNDSKVAGSVPVATQTSYNLAVVTGSVATSGSTYSGGLENLPRFHENWTGIKAIIRGAFVRTFESEIATGVWGKSGVYSAPVRDWQFDSDFYDLGKLPPFTPISVEVRRMVWGDNLSSRLSGDY